jgi:hypothetical protein
MRCHEEVERLDETLASFARAEAGLRLRLGQVLEVLGRGKQFELGFSSIAAYALERCDRSVRWVEAARCLARRLEALPELRRAVAHGRVSWSMGELLARAAQPRDEARWIEAAESRTVREMRGLVEAELDERATGRAVLNAHATGEAVLDARDGGGIILNGRATGEAELDGRATGEAGLNGHATGDAELDGCAMGEAVLNGRAADGSVWVFTGAHVDDEHVATRASSASESGEARDGVGFEQMSHDEPCTLTCTVDREDAWLFEATRTLLEQLGVQGADAQVEALLAEGQGTLLAALPPGALDLDRSGGVDAAQHRWLEELGRWRAEAEALCEERFRDAVLGSSRVVDAKVDPKAIDPNFDAQAADPALNGVEAALGLSALERASCHELDGMLRGLSRLLARHELELSRLVLQFHRADGWRRLGYASEAQYARERLGLSRSSLVARRALALRLEKLPCVAEALGAGQIGVEAAVQVVRVATPSTQAAWVERARQRTLKHLREEVAAALVAVRLSGEADCPPPMDREMAAFQELEQAVVSGRAFQPQPANDSDGAHGADALGINASALTEPTSDGRRAWLVMLGSLARWLDGGVQVSAGARQALGSRGTSSAGRVVLQWRVSRANYVAWRGLEAQARRWLPSGMSWLRFLCLSVWSAWRHLLGTSVAYGQIYIRDRFRCSSPVCSRRDVTPHHLQFRSAGGSDAPRNITSVCTWCHLCGVHGGRIRAVGTAELIRWELGTPGRPCVVVHGRERGQHERFGLRERWGHPGRGIESERGFSHAEIA